jgi:TolB-like protein/Tfp pilus assembly protein PilF
VYLAINALSPHPRHPAAPAPTASPAVIAEKSIAVLPFADLSERKDQEYFSDGLAEELLDLLAKTPGLHVIARTSSFSFKGKSDDIPTIGAKLRVANILEGSVRKFGDHLRVTTQLVRADTAEHLWSETYEADARDIFKVQDEIAAAVVSVLKLKLTQGGRTNGTSNPDAYNEYLLGRQHQRSDTPDGRQRAIAAYQRAIALDPHYAAAYAGLASAEYRLADFTADPTGLKVAKSHADQAIVEGPDQAEGYAVRGNLRSRADWDWTGALSDLQKAVALNPGDARIQHSYGTLLGLLGRFPQATAALITATRLDPLSTAAWDDLGLVLMASGDYQGARHAFGRELEIQPDDSFALDNLGSLQLITRAPADALATYRKISEEPLRDAGIAMAEHSLGNEQQSKQALDGAIATGAQGFASQIADVFAWRNEKDKAFEWLERAHGQHDGGLAELNTDVLLASLHDDPRFKALRRQINLPD